jgi:hypothetical protein
MTDPTEPPFPDSPNHTWRWTLAGILGTLGVGLELVGATTNTWLYLRAGAVCILMASLLMWRITRLTRQIADQRMIWWDWKIAQSRNKFRQPPAEDPPHAA